MSVLAGCGGDPSGPLSAGDLREGYTIAALTETGAGRTKTNIVVTDVAASGDVLAVVGVRVTMDEFLNTGSFEPVLILSRDRGRTWSVKGLVGPDNFPYYNTGSPGILLSDNKAFVTINAYRTVPNVLGGDIVYTFWRLARLDLDTGRFEPIGNVEFPHQGEMGGRLTAAWSETDPRSPGNDAYGNWYWLTFDPQTEMITSGSKPFKPGDCVTYQGPTVYFNGRWAGLCPKDDTTTCIVTLDPMRTDGPQVGSCYPRASVANLLGMFDSEIGLRLVRLIDGVATIEGAKGGVLGSGQIVSGYSGGMHDRWGGFVALEENSKQHLFQLTRRGIWPVPLTAPCRDADHCPAWLSQLRPGGLETLLVYDVTRGGQQAIVVGLEGGLLDPGPPKMGPADASKMEKLCMAESTCFPAANFPSGTAGYECLERWKRPTTAPGTPDPAYERFLAADPTDCASLAAVDPMAAVVHQPCAGSRCEGDRLIACSYDIGVGAYDCADVNGGKCTMLSGKPGCWADLASAPADETYACDAKGRAVLSSGGVGVVKDCAAHGLACIAGECKPAPNPCPTSNLSECRGAILWDCANGMVTDCSRFGFACDPRGCGVNDDIVQCMQSDSGCAGTTLTYCMSGTFKRTVDCAELGLSCIASAPNGPSCGR